MRKSMLCGVLAVATASCLCLLACSDDDDAVTCGDDVAEGAEACDGNDLLGLGCADVIDGSSGTLACTAACAFDVTGCTTSQCGDGMAEGSEECDQADQNGLTCADLFPGATGELACAADCTRDTSGCIYCGNGIAQFGEACDCGLDPANLPEHCTDINGGDDANCTDSCERLDFCGDGIVSGNEECDCGMTQELKHPSCDSINGASSSGCETDCTSM